MRLSKFANEFLNKLVIFASGLIVQVFSISGLLHKAQKEEQRQKIMYNKRAHGDKVKQDVGYAKEEKQQ